MARLDCYQRPGGAPGFVVDVQAEPLRDLRSRVVIPLLPPRSGLPSIRPLNPTLVIRGSPYVLWPQLMAAVSLKELGRVIETLDRYHDDIGRAMDYLFFGI